MLADLQVRRDRHGIRHIAGDKFLHVGMAGEIEPFIPRPEARRVCGEPLQGFGRYDQPNPLTFGGECGDKICAS